jgi:hypothetical protein
MIIKNINGQEINTDKLRDEEAYLLESVENLRKYCHSINRTCLISVDRKISKEEYENCQGKVNDIHHLFWSMEVDPSLFKEISKLAPDIKWEDVSDDLKIKFSNDRISFASKMKLLNSLHTFVGIITNGIAGVFPVNAVDFSKLPMPPENSDNNEK